MRTRILPGILLETTGTLFLRNKSRKDKEMQKEDSYINDLLCRFVFDGSGTKIGESVAVYDDALIVKSGSKYLGVPLEHIEDEGKTILVKGLVEQNKAEGLGEKWRRESFSAIGCKEEEKDGI